MARGEYNLPETKVRWGPQSILGIPATSLPYQAGLVSEALAPTPGQIPNPELFPGSQASTPISGSVAVGGALAITLRLSDAQTLVAQIQGFADRVDLTPISVPPGPTGAHLLTLSPTATTSQQVPLTFEVWRDDKGGGLAVFDAWISSAVFTWAEQSLVTAALTVEAARATYWGNPEAVGLNDTPLAYLTGYPSASRREPRRAGTTGDATVELLTETSPGIWDARAMLGRPEILDIVDTVIATPTLTSASLPGTVDFRDLLYAGDWVSVQEEGAAYEVASVTETTVTLTTNFSATLTGKRLMRTWGAPSGTGATFEVRTGPTPEGRPQYAEVTGTHDGLIFGDKVLRTLFTTAGVAVPTGDVLTLTGTVSVTVSTNVWTGTGTAFLAELASGMTIFDGSAYYVVTSVTNDSEFLTQELHPSGLSGATISARRQWRYARDRPEWARVVADEEPVSEIFAEFLFGPTGETSEAEVVDFSLTITPPRPAQTRVGSGWPGTVTQSGVRSVVVTANVVYGPETQALHNLLERSDLVAMVVTTRNGSPVVSPITPGEEQFAAVETRMTLTAPNLRNVSSQRQTATGGAGRNTFAVNASAHPDGISPDITLDLVTSSPALLVEP